MWAHPAWEENILSDSTFSFVKPLWLYNYLTNTGGWASWEENKPNYDKFLVSGNPNLFTDTD